MNARHPTMKFLAATTAFIFLVTSFAITPSASASALPLTHEVSSLTAGTLAIPAEFGQITDTVLGDANAPAFIHIQSAHGNYSAEKNTEKLLAHISKNTPVKLMLLEGAASKLQPERFRLFPEDPAFNRTVTDKLMQEGYLTGPENFLIDQTSTPVKAYGVEDVAAYKMDREAFIQVVQKERAAERIIASLRASIDKQFSPKLNKDLLSLVRQEEAFGSQTTSFESWLKTLGEGSRKHLKQDLSDAFYQNDYPFLIRYFRLQAIGSKIDRDKALKEAALFMKELKKHGVSEPVIQRFEDESRLPKLESQGYSPLRQAFDMAFDKLPKDFSMASWPNWTLYAQHIILMEELDGKGLHVEALKLRDQIQTVLAKTYVEKEYLAAARQLYLLRRLFALELTRSEYEELNSKRDSFLGIRTSKKRGTKTSPESQVPSPAVQTLFATAMSFYATAIVRENRMFTNALTRMKDAKEQRAVIITGGFHAEGLKALAASKHCSYLQITPRITEVSKRDHQIYLRSILGSRDIETSQMSPWLALDPAMKTVLGGQVSAWIRSVREIVLNMIHSEEIASQPALKRALANTIFSVPAPAPVLVAHGTKAARSELRHGTVQDFGAKKAPGTERLSNEEESFLVDLSYDLMEKGRASIEDIPDAVAKRLAQIFPISQESQTDLLAGRREPTTFRGVLAVLLEKKLIKFVVDDLSDQETIAQVAAVSRHLQIAEKVVDPLVYPRLTPYTSPMGAMAYLKIDNIVPVAPAEKLIASMDGRNESVLKRVQGRTRWVYGTTFMPDLSKQLSPKAAFLIHVPKALWDKKSTDVDFLSQIVVHELAESVMTSPDRMTPHRLASMLELFFASPAAKKAGVSDVNLWFLENASNEYLSKLAEGYSPSDDQTLGSFYEALKKEAQRRSLSLPRIAHLNLSEYVDRRGKPRQVKKTPGTLQVLSDELATLLATYGKKGDTKRVSGPVVNWIQEHALGKEYEPLLRLIEERPIVFKTDTVVDAGGKPLMYFPRDSKHVRGPGIVFFLSDEQEPAAKRQNQKPIEIHITKELWEKKKDDVPYLAQILVMAYILNYVPGIDGMTRSAFAGLSALHFASDYSRRTGLNDVDLDVLDRAAEAKDVAYFFHLLGTYRSSRDPLGNFKRAINFRLNDIFKADPLAAANAIHNEQDLMFYFMYLFEEGFQHVLPVHRLAAITKRLQELTEKNPALLKFLPPTTTQWFFQDFSDGPDNPVYMPQSILAFLPYEDVMDFKTQIPPATGKTEQAILNLVTDLKTERTAQQELKRGLLQKIPSGTIDTAAQEEVEKIEHRIKEMNRSLDDVLRRLAEIQAKPFVRWMTRQIDQLLTVEGNRKVLAAIYGQSGAGKTTVTDILLKELRQEMLGDSTDERNQLVNFISSDAYLKFGGARYDKLPDNTRYTWLKEQRLYEPQFERDLRDLLAGREVVTNEDIHKPKTAQSTLADKDVAEGRRPLQGNLLQVLIMDLTVFGFDPGMKNRIPLVVSLVFENDQVRLDRRYDRDARPKKEGGSRGDSHQQIRVDIAEKALREGLNYMLPMLRDLVEIHDVIYIWVPDTNKLVKVTRAALEAQKKTHFLSHEEARPFPVAEDSDNRDLSENAQLAESRRAGEGETSRSELRQELASTGVTGEKRMRDSGLLKWGGFLFGMFVAAEILIWKFLAEPSIAAQAAARFSHRLYGHEAKLVQRLALSQDVFAYAIKTPKDAAGDQVLVIKKNRTLLGEYNVGEFQNGAPLRSERENIHVVTAKGDETIEIPSAALPAEKVNTRSETRAGEDAFYLEQVRDSESEEAHGLVHVGNEVTVWLKTAKGLSWAEKEDILAFWEFFLKENNLSGDKGVVQWKDVPQLVNSGLLKTKIRESRRQSLKRLFPTVLVGMAGYPLAVFMRNVLTASPKAMLVEGLAWFGLLGFTLAGALVPTKSDVSAYPADAIMGIVNAMMNDHRDRVRDVVSDVKDLLGLGEVSRSKTLVDVPRLAKLLDPEQAYARRQLEGILWELTREESEPYYDLFRNDTERKAVIKRLDELLGSENRVAPLLKVWTPTQVQLAVIDQIADAVASSNSDLLHQWLASATDPLVISSTMNRLLRDEQARTEGGKEASSVYGEAMRLLQARGAELQKSARSDVRAAVETFEKQGFTLYRLTDPASGSSIEVMPERGNTVTSMKVKIGGQEREILFYPEDLKKSGGIPILWPFANRIGKGTFTFNGEKHSLSGVPGTKDAAGGNTYHGMVRYEPWQVESSGVSPNGVFITSSLETKNFPEMLKHFGSAKISVTYRLDGSQLSIETTVQNLDTKAIPMSLAFHPWFKAPLADRSQYEVEIPGEKRWIADGEQVPTGELSEVSGKYDLRKLIPIGQNIYDDVFTGLQRIEGQSLSTIYDPVSNTTIKVAADAGYDHLVLFVPPDQGAMSIEPQTSSTDSFNLVNRGIKEATPVILAPGKTFSANISISAGEGISSAVAGASRSEVRTTMERLEQIKPTAEALSGFLDSYEKQLVQGLAGDPAGHQALLSYVPMPTGKEKGLYWAVDFGGTNLRAIAYRFDGQGHSERVGEPLKVRLDELDPAIFTGSAENLFGHFAKLVKQHSKALAKQGLILPEEQQSVKIGFTYSYPAQLNGRVDSAIATQLTKNLRVSGLVGKDVAELFNQALDGVSDESFRNARVLAVVNDTIGTLVASADPKTVAAGIIMGSGHNASYGIPVKMIKKFKDSEGWTAPNMIVNGETGASTRLPIKAPFLSWIDDAMIAEEKPEGKGEYEKMIAGMYLPELVRRHLRRFVEAGELFNGQMPETLLYSWAQTPAVDPETLTAMLLGNVNQVTQKEVTATRTVENYGIATENMAAAKVAAMLGVADITPGDAQILIETTKAIYRRAGYLSAVEVMALALRDAPKLDRFVKIAIDGSLFEKQPFFRRALVEGLQSLAKSRLGDASKADKIQLMLVKDGSGYGAAVIAATVDARSETRRLPSAVAKSASELFDHLGKTSADLPKNPVVVVLGNPLPAYPAYLADALRHLKPSKVLIVGNGVKPEDRITEANPSGTPAEYQRIEAALKVFMAKDAALKALLKGRILVDPNDVSMNTGQNIDSVISILNRKGLTPKGIVLVQAPQGLLVSQRIFQQQWNQKEIAAPATKDFYTYALPAYASKVKAFLHTGKTVLEPEMMYFDKEETRPLQALVKDLVTQTGRLHNWSGKFLKAEPKEDLTPQVVANEAILSQYLQKDAARSETRVIKIRDWVFNSVMASIMAGSLVVTSLAKWNGLEAMRWGIIAFILPAGVISPLLLIANIMRGSRLDIMEATSSGSEDRNLHRTQKARAEIRAEGESLLSEEVPEPRSDVRLVVPLDMPQIPRQASSSLGARLGTAAKVAYNTVSFDLLASPAYAAEIEPKLFAGTPHYRVAPRLSATFVKNWPVFSKILSRFATATTERMVIDQRQGIPDPASVLPLATFALYNPKVSVVLALIASPQEVEAFAKELSALIPKGGLPQNFKIRAFANENEFVGAFAGYYNEAAPLGKSVALITDREDSLVTRKVNSRRHLLSVVGAADPLKQTASALLAADLLLKESIWSLGYHFVAVEKLGGLESLMADLTSYVAAQAKVLASA